MSLADDKASLQRSLELLTSGEVTPVNDWTRLFEYTDDDLARTKPARACLLGILDLGVDRSGSGSFAQLAHSYTMELLHAARQQVTPQRTVFESHTTGEMIAIIHYMLDHLKGVGA